MILNAARKTMCVRASNADGRSLKLADRREQQPLGIGENEGHMTEVPRAWLQMRPCSSMQYVSATIFSLIRRAADGDGSEAALPFGIAVIKLAGQRIGEPFVAHSAASEVTHPVSTGCTPYCSGFSFMAFFTGVWQEGPAYFFGMMTTETVRFSRGDAVGEFCTITVRIHEFENSVLLIVLYKLIFSFRQRHNPQFISDFPVFSSGSGHFPTLLLVVNVSFQLRVRR